MQHELAKNVERLGEKRDTYNLLAGKPKEKTT
jgi:hypothetical protein